MKWKLLCPGRLAYTAESMASTDRTMIQGRQITSAVKLRL